MFVKEWLYIAFVKVILKDTTVYLNKTPNMDLPEETLLVTMDVTSLYTTIPHKEGIEAFREVWETRTTHKPSTDFWV